jgi:serine/threonine-protein phosphatase PGAM5
MGVHHLLLVRHGQYDNMFGDDGELNQTGRFQALLAADALRGQAFDAVFVSPILRAQQTAEIIFAALDEISPVNDTRLEECVPTIPKRFADWFARHRPQLGSSQTEFCREKLKDFYDSIFLPLAESAPDRSTLIIAHGNVIRYLLTLSMDAGTEAWSNMIVYHCSFSRVMIEPNGYPVVMSINDQAHLAPEFRSEA